MIELDSLPDISSVQPVGNRTGSVFAFVDDPPEISREENTKRVISALRRELGAVLIHTDNPVFQRLLDKQERGEILSTEERNLLDSFLHEASAGL